MDQQLRLVSGAIGCGAYLVGGWLLLSRLVAGGTGPIVQSAPDGSLAFTSSSVLATPPDDRGATHKNVMVVHVEDGSTQNCLVSVHLVSADAIMLTHGDFAASASTLDCV